MRDRTSQTRHWRAAVRLGAACAAVILSLRSFLPLHTLPSRGDPALPFQGSDLTPQWYPWLKVSADALWRAGTLPFWDPYHNAGAPLFEVPEAGVASLATLLSALVVPEAAIKWSMLLHVAIGMAGTFQMARRLDADDVAAAVGAVGFGLNPYLLDHFRVGHLSHILPMCLAPWVLCFAWKALVVETGWWRNAAVAGIVAGLQVLEGGTSVFLYSMLALLLLAVTCGGRGAVAWTANLVRVGIVTGLCLMGTAAPQLVPMLGYMELTGRAGGFGFEQSSQAISEVAHPYPGALTAAMMAVGVLTLVLHNQRRAALWLAAVAGVGVAASSLTPVYYVLWKLLPGFHYQRIPQRAIVMLWLVAPVLVAAGVRGLSTMLRRVAPAASTGAWFVAAGCAWEWLALAPAMPPMSDPRVALQANTAMQWVRAHADGSRVHVWESADRHWGADNVTVPLGLEAITSYTPSEHHDYLPGDFDDSEHRTFIGDSYRNPARFWGLLNVRYVLSSTPRAEPGFHLATSTQPCPVEICQPAKAAGHLVYENEKWLPRAWMVPRAVAIVGLDDDAFRAALDVLNRPDFDPRRLVIVQVRPGAFVPAVDAVFSAGIEMPSALPVGSAGASAELTRLIEAAPAAGPDVRVVRRDNNTTLLTAPGAGWLVASEKAGIYPGWRVAVNGRPSTHVRADGVLVALPVLAGDVVRFDYSPPGLLTGAALFGTMVIGLSIAAYATRRST